MNFSNPILICHENEHMRVMFREMLMKNGFFHIAEAASSIELIEQLKSQRNFLVLLDSNLYSNEILKFLKSQKYSLVLVKNSNSKTPSIAARMGIEHLISYPIQSRKLMKRINSLI